MFFSFHFARSQSSIAQAFLNNLCSIVWDRNEAPTVRQSAVGYIASMLARGKFISQKQMKGTIKKLSDWALDYVNTSDSSRNTTSIRAHLVFYAVCEAIFYVIAFRSRDLTQSNKNIKFLEDLKTSTLVNSHLNPLRVCAPAVATAFAGVAQAYQFAYCHLKLEENARRKLAMVYQNEIVMPDETLDTSFPYDPYLLKRSNAYIVDIYQLYPNGDADPNQLADNNEQRRRKRMESLSMLSSLDDNDFLTDPKRNKINDISKSHEKEMALFAYGTSPGFH